MTQNNFLFRTYGKSEFALLMFPTIDDPKVAQAKPEGKRLLKYGC